MPRSVLSKPAIRLSAVSIAAALAFGALAPNSPAQAQNSQAQGASPPDLSGIYQCKPNPSPCLWSGKTATISQSGKKLQIKGESGAVSDATLTSDITISAGGTFNSLGIVLHDHSIDWSDGTNWSKQ